jgi:plastocyanin
MRSIMIVRRALHTTEFQAALLCALVAGTLAAPAFAAGGAVTGKVDAMPAKYLAETVVYLKDVPGQYAAKTVALDQKGMKFIPHIITVTAGDTVRFENHDTVAHNVFSPDNDPYNLGTFKPGETRTHTFTQVGMYTQLCSIHPEMLGFIFVGQNPYAAVVDSSGAFTIKGVPPGSYEAEVWNSHLKAKPEKVTVTEGNTAKVSFSLHR